MPFVYMKTPLLTPSLTFHPLPHHRVLPPITSSSSVSFHYISFSFFTFQSCTLICRWAAAVGHHDTHSCRGEECTTNWPSFFSVSACVLTCVWLFCSGCVSHFEWLPVRACFKAPEPNRFPSLSPSLPPPPAASPPSAARPQFNLDELQLEFS